jgi:hypothetical protein
MSTPSSGSGSARRERAAALHAAKANAERRRRRIVLAAVVIVVLAVGGIIAAITTSSSGSKKASPSPSPTTTAPGPEGVAIQQGTPLAPLTTAAKGSTVQGVQCQSSEQPAYHIHTHLSVYVNGVLRPITAGVGVVEPQSQQGANPPFYGATSCYYWLHVHTQDGVIHVESPTTQAYTLGQFFAIWGQPLTKTSVGPATGKLTVFVDGKPFTGDPASIKLGSREDVQIDVGTPVPFQPVDWSHSQL